MVQIYRKKPDSPRAPKLFNKPLRFGPLTVVVFVKRCASAKCIITNNLPPAIPKEFEVHASDL